MSRLRAAAGAVGYALALGAVAGMAVRVHAGRALDRVLYRPIDRRAGQLWGDKR